MPNRNRLLLLLHTLHDHSDDDMWLTTADLRSVLEAEGLDCSIRSLRKDIQSLCDSGFDIGIRETEGKPTSYAWQDREWSSPELQILIDAVSSAQFIPKERSEELIGKLSGMAGPSHRGELKPQILVSEHVKAKNKNMIYSVQAIRKAIEEDRQIKFKYLRYNKDKQQVPKHAGTSGEDYIVSPYATVWNNDRYYLVGWSEKRQKIAVYRIDRMMVPTQVRRKRVPPPEDFDVRDYTDKVFRMYDGMQEEVTLRCRMAILDQVIDRFGEDVKLNVLDNATFDVTVPVCLSGTFYAWVFQYTGEMRILEPEYVRNEYAGMLENAVDMTLG